MRRGRVSGRKLVRLLSNGTPELTTGKLFLALAQDLRRQGKDVDIDFRVLPRGVAPKSRLLLRTELGNMVRGARYNELRLHSPLAISFLPILATRLRGGRVIAYVWDLYPDSARIVGTLKSRPLLFLYSAVEQACLALAQEIVVPSSDYSPALSKFRGKLRIQPLWPTTTPVSTLRRHPIGSVLRVGFAGQINAIRDLEAEIDELVEVWTGSGLEVHVFSPSPVPSSLKRRGEVDPRLTVIERGLLSESQLQLELQRLDVGWVCLSKEFPLPAFPSKSLTYMCAGLPTLYTGPELPGYIEWLEGNNLGFRCSGDVLLSADSLGALTDHFESGRQRYLENLRVG